MPNTNNLISQAAFNKKVTEMESNTIDASDIVNNVTLYESYRDWK